MIMFMPTYYPSHLAMVWLLLSFALQVSHATVHFSGATYESVSWTDCDGSNMYTVAFNTVDNCFPLSRFQNPKFTPSYKAFCNSTNELPRSVSGNGIPCSLYGLAFLGAYWCTIGAGILPATVSIDISLMTVASCLDGAQGLANLQAAVTFISQPPSEHRVAVKCSSDQGIPQISMCSDSSGSAVAPFVHDALRINFTASCVAGFSMECSYCRPYLDPTTVAQPYYFLVVPGLQLMLIVCAQLFLFDTLSDRIRRRVERYHRERKPPEAEHTVEFTRYVVAELLQHSRRLRLNQTLRKRDGKRSIVRMKKIFEEENARSLTKDEWIRLTDPRYGVVLTDASFSREQCITIYQFVIQQVLEELNVTKLTDDQQRDIVLEMEWFWRDVTHRGARAYGGSLTGLSDAFKRHWALIGGKRLVYHIPHQTTAADDDISVVFFGERDEMEYLVSAELEDRVSTVHGYLYVLLKQVNASARIDELKLMFADGTPLTWHRDDTIRTVLENSDSRMASNPTYRQYWSDHALREGQTRTLPLRFHTFRIVPDAGFSREFRVPSADILVETREAFLLDADFCEPKYDPEGLCRDTHEVLTKLLDSQFATNLAEKLAMLAGDETIFDYEVRDEFWVRDDIPQITSVEERKKKNAEVRQYRQEANADTLMCLECFFATEEEVENESITVRPSSSSEPVGSPKQRRRDPRRKLAVSDPDTFIFKPSKDHPIITFDKEHHVDPAVVRKVYNDAFELLVTWDPNVDASELQQTEEQKKSRKPIFGQKAKKDALGGQSTGKGVMKRGIMKHNQYDRPLLRDALSDLYTTIENRLSAVSCDLNAVYVPRIVAEHREIIESYSHLVPIVTKEEQVFVTMYSINVHVLLLQIIFGVYFFINCAIAGNETSTRQSDATPFTGYEVTFFRFLNSGTPVALLGATLTNIFTNRERRLLSYYFFFMDWGLLLISVLLVGPPLVTHLISGTVLYLWVLVVCIAVFMSPCFLLFHLYKSLRTRWLEDKAFSGDELMERHRKLKIIFTSMMLWFQFSSFVLMTAMFQSTFNWAYLFYHRDALGLDYLKVLSSEWDSRSPECYFASIVSSVPNTLQLLSSIIG